MTWERLLAHKQDIKQQLRVAAIRFNEAPTNDNYNSLGVLVDLRMEVEGQVAEAIEHRRNQIHLVP